MREINPAWEVHPTEVAAAQQGGEVLLVDVRRQDEWDKTRIAGATLIPLHELEGRVEELSAYKSRRVVVYCHHGARSLHGTAILRKHGFAEVYSMAGGIDAYSVLVDPGVARY